MAVEITPFPHQSVQINTPFSLDIAVSGNPSDVSVDGRIKGFVYHWTGTHIELRGTPTVLEDDLEIIVTADDQTYRGTLSIVRVAPRIAPLSVVTVQRGIEIVVAIPITGHISKLVIDGPWIGLRDRLTAAGGELYGVIPNSSTANFTARTFDFSVTAYNGTVFSSATLTLELAIGS